ncbi:hypothetical protein GCM10027161_11950 [Microbispora hainanensis]
MIQMNRCGACVKALVIGGLAAGLACATVAGPAQADVNRHPPRINSVIPVDGGLRVTWGPDTFFPGTVAGETTVLTFGGIQEGKWDDRGATTSFTIPSAHVRAYAGQAPRVTVCYLWPSVGHPSECSAGPHPDRRERPLLSSGRGSVPPRAQAAEPAGRRLPRLPGDGAVGERQLVQEGAVPV